MKGIQLNTDIISAHVMILVLTSEVILFIIITIIIIIRIFVRRLRAN